MESGVGVMWYEDWCAAISAGKSESDDLSTDEKEMVTFRELESDKVSGDAGFVGKFSGRLLSKLTRTK